MSSLWHIKRAIVAVYDKATYNILYDEWHKAYMSSEHEDFMAFQHYVQVNHKEVYKKTLAYARLMGWV
jgi:hypothetical protein